MASWNLYFCQVCGGPFRAAELRKLSQMQDDDEDPAPWDDLECDCPGDFNSRIGPLIRDRTNIDENNPLLRHYPFCRVIRGYDAKRISWKQITWLDDVRMLCLKRPETMHLGPESAGPYLITNKGDVDDYEGGTFWVWGNDEVTEHTVRLTGEDEFFFHATCWNMLLEVHRKTISSKTDLNLAELVFTLASRCQPNGEVDWEDGFDYGGALKFQEKFGVEKWNPSPGFEYLVADPAEEVDFSPVISLATNPQPHASSASNTQPQPILTSSDCFVKLPREVQLLILEMLPSESAVDLFVASPSFRELGAHLPDSFWKSRLAWDVPWADGPQLRRQISEEKKPIRYKGSVGRAEEGLVGERTG